MSSEADQAAADKRAADEAAAAASAAAALVNWPTGGYYMLIPLLLISMCIVLVLSVDVSTICLVLHSYMIKYQYVHVMLMFYSWMNIIEKLPRSLTLHSSIVIKVEVRIQIHELTLLPTDHYTMEVSFGSK
jgi:hypothetical protein